MAAPAGFINPQDSPYGAAGDNATDDRAALQNALDDCAAQGKDLWCPKAGGYRFNDTLIVPAGVNVLSWDTWVYGGSPDRTALQIGTTGQHNDAVEIQVAIDSPNDSEWGDANYIGVRALNCRGCDLRILIAGADHPEVFFAGVNLHAESGFACEGNIVSIGYALYNRHAILIDGAGSPRDNLIIGGRITITSSGPSVQPAHYRLGANARNNYWCYASLEAVPPEGIHPLTMWTEGAFNEIRHHRNEMVNQDTRMRVDGAGAAYNLDWDGHQQSSGGTFPMQGELVNGAPSGVNAVIPSRNGPDLGPIGGVP